MKTNSPRLLLVSLMFATLAAGSALDTLGQSTGQRPPPPRPTVIMPTEAGPPAVAKDREMVCGGYLQVDPARVGVEIVGGEQEQEQHAYSQGNNLFINAGREQGVQLDQEFSIIRPRGNYKSDFSGKGRLGIYTQELGRLKVINVKDHVAVVLVTLSCDEIMLGDLVVPVTTAQSPVVQIPAKLDRFSDSTGKQVGRIVLSRDGLEMPSVGNIVYIDLGTDDNVKPSDVFTIFRHANSPQLVSQDKEVSPNADSGFQSKYFKGGEFSIDSPRTKDQDAPGIRVKNEKSSDVKDKHTDVPRKIVGQLVITNVQKRTATAVITIVTQEVHTGDYVEMN